MKKLHEGICIGMMVVAAQAGAQLVSDDYESDVAGTIPVRPDAVSPSAVQSDVAVVVVDETANIAGTGNALHIIDDNGTLGVQCLYDFVPGASEQRSTVRIDFSFAPVSTPGNGGVFYVALGEYQNSMTSYRDRFLNCSLLDDGTISFASGDKAVSIIRALQASHNTLSIFVNDLNKAILYTGLDDKLHTLGADSVAYWLNGEPMTFAGQGYTGLADRDTTAGAVLNSTNNIGRVGFVSLTSALSPDYVIDNLVVNDLPEISSSIEENGLVYEGDTGLVYVGYSNEGQDNPVNTVPDFSNAGYQGGGVSIPFVPTAVTITDDGLSDDTARIQAAIDQVSALAVGPNGFRGALLIKAGDYSVSDTLIVRDSGVVIRGEGSQSGGTKITYTKTVQSNLFEVDSGGSDPSELFGTSQTITDAYVPVGAKSFRVADASGFSVGDPIRLEYLMNSTWISDLGMDSIIDPDPLVGDESWSASSYQLKFQRTITAIDGNRVTVNAPVVQAIETRYGGAEIYKYNFFGQLENIGFEGLQLVSTYASENDEAHGWDAIVLKGLKNGWIRQVTARYFGYGLARIQDYSSQITVEDCAMLDPKSQTIGGRKYSFELDDSGQILIQRCLTRGGRHDFATSSQTPGPNVFSDCRANMTFADSGPHHRYATGQLYDNVMCGTLNVQNRLWSGTGHGWAGAQIMFWNCDTGGMICETPTGAMSWSVGSKGPRNNGGYTNETDGIWYSQNTHVPLRSLYHAQLRERLGEDALRNVILPAQAEGDIWVALDAWNGEGLFGDDVVAWVDATAVDSADTVQLKGLCRNLQMLENGVSYTWSQISGPGTIVFGNTADPETSATVSGLPGIYGIELEVSDGTTTVSSTVSVAIVGAPQIQALGAVPFDLDSVELRGRLLSSVPADVEIVWDVTDQGTNRLAWAGRQTFAAQAPGAFGAEAAALQPGSTYVYRCMASNEYGVAWSDVSFFALHPSGYIQLEDFEAYAPGTGISGQGTWGGTAVGSEFTVQEDPDDSENQVLYFDQGVSDAVYLNHDKLRMTNGTISTFFFRTRAFCEVPYDPANPANELWLRASLSDVAAATEFSDGETDTAIEDSGAGNLALFSTAAGTWEQLKWHRVWFVVDNASDLFDVYVQPEGGTQTQAIADRSFRNGAATNDLVSFMLKIRYNSGQASHGDAWFDDFYVAHGADMHAYSPVGFDMDLDGLPDSWELGSFGSYSASSGGADEDYDGDGFIDLHEYIAGTDAADADSRLEISAATPGSAAGQFVLSWQAVAGKRYTIKAATNLVDGIWNPVATGIPGIEPLNTYTVELENAVNFYGIELEQ